MKTISVVTPCYNEEENVRPLYERIKSAFETLGNEYQYEHIYIDNASRDRTLDVLRELAAADPRVKVIVNARNFGHIRSPMHGFLQATGDAVVLMVSDLQDPPEMLIEMVRHWAAGMPLVLGIKSSSDESRVMYWVRGLYYRVIRRLSGMETLDQFTGFGLYDRSVVELMRAFDDPYPYFRGMIAEIGLPSLKIPYHQPSGTRGFTKNNFYSLFDTAILGITNFSKVPLRILTAFGFVCAVLSVLFSIGYLCYKLLYWDRFSVGVAPVAIGLFFFSSVQLIFIGVVGEYVGAIHTQVQKRPLVVERERINFGPRDRSSQARSEAYVVLSSGS